ERERGDRTAHRYKTEHGSSGRRKSTDPARQPREPRSGAPMPASPASNATGTLRRSLVPRAHAAAPVPGSTPGPYRKASPGTIPCSVPHAGACLTLPTPSRSPSRRTPSTCPATIASGLDKNVKHDRYVMEMALLPAFTEDGLLPPADYELTLD